MSPGQRRPGAGSRPGPRPPRQQSRRAAATAVDPARLAAYHCLRAVAERGAYANLVLPRLLDEAGLSGRDAGLATELGYGALRGSGTYDEVIAVAAARPVAEIDPAVLDALRLGAHQLLGGLRVPPHAAVATTVELVRAEVGQAAAGFANAVLRRVGEADRDEWIDRLSAGRDRLDRLALAHAHPRWVVQAYADALGPDAADELEPALGAGNVAPAVHLVARPGRVDRDELAARSGGKPGPWSPYAVVHPGGDPGALPELRDGRAAVQDEGSQLVALALAAVPLDGPDRRWLDLCAGPGGKAGLLGAVAAQRDARLLAADRAPHRATLVARTCVGLPVGVVTADGLRPPWRDAWADRVLVDAPCSGLGALRRRPEARWRKQPGDLPPLRATQAALLDAAVIATRPGGVVAYVTCSPHVAETVAVVRAALRRHPALSPVDARPYFPGMPGLGAGPHVQLWPHRHGTDAMFCALLRVGG